MQYTVRQATPTGKVDSTYGTEYIVHFLDDQREVKMSRQKPVMEGQIENGTIVDGKFGAYFKKDPFVPGQTSTPVQPATSSFVTTKPSSDGMRQGMCINNAANYVNALEAKLGYSEWAKEVHGYASALYSQGDLAEIYDETATDDLAEKVKNVFNGA